jgi:hypothetical protein
MSDKVASRLSTVESSPQEQSRVPFLNHRDDVQVVHKHTAPRRSPKYAILEVRHFGVGSTQPGALRSSFGDLVYFIIF